MKKSVLATLLVVLMLSVLLTVGAAASGGPVAQIGSTGYSTLQEAIDAAGNKTIIKLLQDCDETGLEVSGKAVAIIPSDGVTIPNIDCQAIGVCGSTDLYSVLIYGDLEKAAAWTNEGAYVNSSLLRDTLSSDYGVDVSGYWYFILYEDVKLNSDVTLAAFNACSSWIETIGDVTVDLNGHTIRQTAGAGGWNGWAALTNNSGHLTITDTSEGQTGKVIGSTRTIEVYDSVTLEAGTLSVLGARPADWTSGGRIVGMQDSAKSFVMNGGSLSLENLQEDENSVLNAVIQNFSPDASVKLNGGSLDIVPAEKAYNDASIFMTTVDGADVAIDIDNVNVSTDDEGITVGKDGMLCIDVSDANEFTAAINALNSTGGTINLLADLTLTDANYIISNDISIVGNGNVIDATVANGADTVAFAVGNNASLTLDAVVLTVNGTKNDDPEAKNDGTAFSLGTSSELKVTGGSVVTLNDVNRGITMGGGDTSKFTVENSSFIVNTVDGNLTNGGTVSFDGAYVYINNCGDYGLSVSDISFVNSTATIENVGYSAIFCNGGDLTLENSDVTIKNSGSKLPKATTTAADYIIDYEDSNTGMNVDIDKTSSLNLIGNKKNAVNVGSGSLNVQGTLEGRVVVNAETTCIVEVVGVETVTVEYGDTFVLPEAPSSSGHVFMGWNSGEKNYAAGDSVKVTGNMTFTAVWANHPDTPYEPDEDEDTPEVPEFPFYDVARGAWYYNAVAYVYNKGLMDGVDTHEFAPEATLTRAMVWTILARMEGVDTTGGATWYAKAQEWATAKGISDGENPNAAITREQFVTMLYRLAGEPAVSGSRHSAGRGEREQLGRGCDDVGGERWSRRGRRERECEPDRERQPRRSRRAHHALHREINSTRTKTGKLLFPGFSFHISFEAKAKGVRQRAIFTAFFILTESCPIGLSAAISGGTGSTCSRPFSYSAKASHSWPMSSPAFPTPRVSTVIKKGSSVYTMPAMQMLRMPS